MSIPAKMAVGMLLSGGLDSAILLGTPWVTVAEFNRWSPSPRIRPTQRFTALPAAIGISSWQPPRSWQNCSR